MTIRRRLERLERSRHPSGVGMPPTAIVIDDDTVPVGEAREESAPGAPVRTFRVHPDTNLSVTLADKGVRAAWPETLTAADWAIKHGAGGAIVDDEGAHD